MDDQLCDKRGHIARTDKERVLQAMIMKTSLELRSKLRESAAFRKQRHDIQNMLLAATNKIDGIAFNETMPQEFDMCNNGLILIGTSRVPDDIVYVKTRLLPAIVTKLVGMPNLAGIVQAVINEI